MSKKQSKSRAFLNGRLANTDTKRHFCYPDLFINRMNKKATNVYNMNRGHGDDASRVGNGGQCSGTVRVSRFVEDIFL